MERKISNCPECVSVDRRGFLAGAGAVLAVGALPSLGRLALAAPSPKSAAESAVARLYGTLTDDQKKVMALPLADDRRNTINANWHITKATVDSFTKEQQAIIHEIVKGVTSEDGYDRLLKQMADDDGGIHNYSIAIFGNPSEKEFEFELTGRHLTLRADGNTKAGVALGGPIVYGHGESGNAEKNLFFYQTKQANKVFEMLEGKQRETALLAQAPQEAAVQLRKEGRPLPGIAGAELTSDQKEQLKKSLEAIMQVYRQEDVAEVMEVVEAGGGLDKLHMSFYSAGDLGNDKVWDIWRIEGPTLVCHFRGSPHVHAYINVARQS